MGHREMGKAGLVPRQAIVIEVGMEQASPRRRRWILG